MPTPAINAAEERLPVFENGPTRSAFNVINPNAHLKGGHFVRYEHPEAFTTDLRETFRKILH